jgi:serine/threonine protein kinase
MAGVLRLVFFALQEYVPGGELFAHLKASSNHHFSEKRTRFYIAEAVLALQHMHEKEHLVYRDIKPENMLLDEQGHLKVHISPRLAPVQKNCIWGGSLLCRAITQRRVPRLPLVADCGLWFCEAPGQRGADIHVLRHARLSGA